MFPIPLLQVPPRAGPMFSPSHLGHCANLASAGHDHATTLANFQHALDATLFSFSSNLRWDMLVCTGKSLSKEQ